MTQMPRVGIYIKPETRYRLNLLKAQLAVRLGRTVNQDEALDYLLDAIGIEASGQNRPFLNGTSNNGAVHLSHTQNYLVPESEA